MSSQLQLPADSPDFEPEADEQPSGPGSPSDPGALEPAAESETLRRLHENMGRFRHHH